MKPIYIGHSFGGSQVFYSAARHPERMRALLLVDTGFGGPPTRRAVEKMAAEAAARGENVSGWGRACPQRDAAQPGLCDAGRGADPLPLHAAAGSRQPLHRRLHRPPLAEARADARRRRARAGPGSSTRACGASSTAPPWGQLIRRPSRPRRWPRSSATARRSSAGTSLQGQRWQTSCRRSVPTIAIPDSEHHIMVDQPLALVAALRACWRSGSERLDRRPCAIASCAPG